MVPFDRPQIHFYSPSIVTVMVNCIVFKIRRKAIYWSKTPIFIPFPFNLHGRGVSRNLCWGASPSLFPSPFPSPFLHPSPSLPFNSPLHSFPVSSFSLALILSLSLPSPPLRSMPPVLRLGGLGER